MAELIKKEITTDVIETFLNGHDPQERIVNLEYSNKDNFISVYYRNQNDDKCISKEPFVPFLWATYDACNKLCYGDRAKVKELMIKYGIQCKALRYQNDDGEVIDEMRNGYRFLFRAIKPMSYSKFLEFFKAAKNPVYRDFNKNNDNLDSFTHIGTAKKDERQYVCATPQEQFLMSTGKRFFKGYDDYDGLLRMIFDLETTGLDTHKDKIIQFGIRFNRPVHTPCKDDFHTFEKILTVTGETEEERNASELNCIITALKIIYKYRPDIITAHNGENFDWNMIINACERLGTTMKDICEPIFGEGRYIRKNQRESILKLGGEIETFNQTVVPGIIVTDSLHAVRRAQATNSNFLKADLKYSTKFLNLSKENRVYTPGKDISSIWNDFEEHYAFNNENGDWYKYDPSYPDIKEQCTKFKPGKEGDNKFIMYTRNYIKEGYTLVSGRYIIERYLLDDLWECDKVEKNLNGADFMLCKFIPVTFQKCCTMGTASQWKAIMMAWSYENDLAIPMAENTGSFTGGLSRLLSVGYKENVAKFDYNSLYPSIILTWAISDKTDLTCSMLKMLEYVLTTREKYKGEKKKADKICDKYKNILSDGTILTKEQQEDYNEAYKQYQINDNLQMVVKKLGNSFFGSYGSNNGAIFPWKSVSCAERTTCTGRQSLRLMIKYFNDRGYEPIVGDSFTGDTPLFIKYKDNGFIDIKPVSEMIDENEVKIDALGREYDYSQKNYYVLCRSGWMEPSYVYRHSTEKPIYEVSEGDMKIDVTEDHSLFNSNQEKIKPSHIDDNTKLEYYNNKLEHSFSECSLDKVVKDAKKLANGLLNRVPVYVLNSSDEYKKLFAKTFNEYKKEHVLYTKTCIAGILYLEK